MALGSAEWARWARAGVGGGAGGSGFEAAPGIVFVGHAAGRVHIVCDALDLAVVVSVGVGKAIGQVQQIKQTLRIAQGDKLEAVVIAEAGRDAVAIVELGGGVGGAELSAGCLRGGFV
ncbi:MAG: hypothetical protein ACE5MH_07105 [Terriglobia bacterium]